MMETMNISNDVIVVDSDKRLYRVAKVREMDSVQYSVTYSLEFIAGYDYISEDSDIQGYVKPENFTDACDVDLIVFPLMESLGERLLSDEYTILTYKPTIHDGMVGEAND